MRPLRNHIGRVHTYDDRCRATRFVESENAQLPQGAYQEIPYVPTERTLIRDMKRTESVASIASGQ